MLNDENQEVVKITCAVLACLAQQKPAKVDMIEKNYFDKVAALLKHDDNEIKLNCVQLIAYLAEDPKGQQLAKSCLDTLNSYLSNEKYKDMKIYLEDCIKVINWVP